MHSEKEDIHVWPNVYYNKERLHFWLLLTDYEIMGQALFGRNSKKPQVLKREEMNVKKLSNLEITQEYLFHFNRSAIL
jgi:hypothetical protein